VRIAWLAGLVDDEGCFNISVAGRDHHGRHIDFMARFLLSMKTGIWVESVKKILNDIDVNYRVSTRKGQTCVAVTGWRQVQKLAVFLTEYSIVKKPLLEQLLTYHPSANNRFPTNEQIKIRADLLDFSRDFNRGKNRLHKWTGAMILKFYGYE